MALPKKRNYIKNNKKNINPRVKLLRSALSSVFDLHVNVACAKEMFTTVIPMLDKADKFKRAEIRKLIRSISKTKTEEETNRKINKLTKSVRELNIANRAFKRSQVVLVVSFFDNFILNLFRLIYRKNSGIINSKMISYEELLSLKTKKDILHKIADKEIYSLMKEKSRSDWIKILDEKEGMNFFDNNKEIIDQFLLLSEKRNIFAHYGDRINEEYLKKCRIIDCSYAKNLKVGDALNVGSEDFYKYCEIILELAFKLSFSVLNNEFNKETEKVSIENYYNKYFGYDYLEKHQWGLAKNIFKYLLSFNEKPTQKDELRMIFLINYCICLKKLNQKRELFKILNDLEKHDFKKIGLIYRLACYMLREKYDESVELIKKMNKSALKIHQLKELVIFEDFRKSPQYVLAVSELKRKKHAKK